MLSTASIDKHKNTDYLFSNAKSKVYSVYCLDTFLKNENNGDDHWVWIISIILKLTRTLLTFVSELNPFYLNFLNYRHSNPLIFVYLNPIMIQIIFQVHSLQVS